MTTSIIGNPRLLEALRMLRCRVERNPDRSLEPFQPLRAMYSDAPGERAFVLGLERPHACADDVAGNRVSRAVDRDLSYVRQFLDHAFDFRRVHLFTADVD